MAICSLSLSLSVFFSLHTFLFHFSLRPIFPSLHPPLRIGLWSSAVLFTVIFICRTCSCHIATIIYSQREKKHSHTQLILPRPLPQMPFPISACFVCYSLMYTVSFSCWIIIIYQHDRWQRSEARHSRMESKMTLALFLFALFISLCLPLFTLWLLLFGVVSLLSMLLLSLLVNFTLNYFNVIKKLVTWNSGHLKKLTYS